MNRCILIALTLLAPLLSAFVPADGASAAVARKATASESETDRSRAFPSVASERPNRQEWQQAQAFPLRGDSNCTANKIREWIRVSCSAEAIESVQLLAGNKASVDAWLADIPVHREFAGRAVVEFPMRLGDVRLFEVNETLGRYGATPTVHIEQSWLTGSEPRLTARRVKRHPAS